MLPTTKFAPLPPCAGEAGGGVTHPAGFLSAGVASGVKRRGKLDLGIILSEVPSVSAATFTGNAAAAAPVRLTRETSDCAHLRAVVVNAGNANACTGKRGLADAARMRLLTANHLRLPVEQVAVASTGLIGVHLPMDRIEAGIGAAAGAVATAGASSAADDFASAIRTTDKHAKSGALDVRLPEGVVRLGFAAKGCGMISPDMATMLCFVTCDAAVTAEAWAELMHGAVAASFNRITVDGQESTNDMVLGFANGASGVEPGEEGLARLGAALQAALLSLAISIVADGEGSTRTVRLTVTGARDGDEAEGVARAVANSPLVKTAFYGRDPNWGRIMQAIGQSLGRDGLHALPARIVYEDLVVVDHGQPAALDAVQQGRLTEVMHQPEIDLTVALNGRGAHATVFFSDLTHDYVTLNAEYST
jgi:glutamate N-acetyltransferase/amino-acid N-acetyltransferase